MLIAGFLKSGAQFRAGFPFDDKSLVQQVSSTALQVCGMQCKA